MSMAGFLAEVTQSPMPSLTEAMSMYPDGWVDIINIQNTQKHECATRNQLCALDIYDLVLCAQGFCQGLGRRAA
jgi:hypothetical protein